MLREGAGKICIVMAMGVEMVYVKKRLQCHGDLALEVGMAHWQWMPGEIHVQDQLKCSVMALALEKAQAQCWMQRGRAGYSGRCLTGARDGLVLRWNWGSSGRCLAAGSHF